MTLLKSLLTLSLLAAPMAQAQYGVGIGSGGNNYGPVPGPGYNPAPPIRPGRPERPERPGRPGRPEYPGRPGGNLIQKTAYIGRTVRNENLPLRQLAGLGREYRGYTIDSVELQLRPSRYSSARVALLIDRVSEEERTVTSESFVVLSPRGSQELGDEARAVALAVRGELHIDRVVVNLRQNSYNPDPGYGRDVIVPIQLPGYIPPSSRIDLTPLIDVYNYRGYTLVGVEITALARFNAAVLEVVVNSFNQGAVSLGRYQSTQVVNMRQNFVIGQSLGNLQLEPRGDSALYGVRLILRR